MRSSEADEGADYLLEQRGDFRIDGTDEPHRFGGFQLMSARSIWSASGTLRDRNLVIVGATRRTSSNTTA